MSAEAPRESVELRDRRDAGPTEVVVTNPWVPVEWIAAHGFAPRGVWSLAGHTAGAVAEGVCAFAHGARNLAEARPQTPIIFTTACDQMRRAADAFDPSGTGHSFLFNLPATWQTPATRRLYHAEVERLGKFLQRLGGHTPRSGTLEAAMRSYNERRARLLQFVEQSPARQAAEAMAQFYDGDARGSWEADSHGGLDACQRGRSSSSIRNGGEGRGEEALGSTGAVAPLPSPNRSSRGEGERPPVALVGGPLTASQWGLFDLIESAGGSVVLNATEPGERCLLSPPPVALQLDSSTGQLAHLCDYYFDHIVDVFQRPNSPLYAWLGARLSQRGVRGIVLWVHVGCDLWRAEAASLREAFGLPVLALDTTETRGAGLRDLSRLAAFIESLQEPMQPFVAYASKDCSAGRAAPEARFPR